MYFSAAPAAPPSAFFAPDLPTNKSYAIHAEQRNIMFVRNSSMLVYTIKPTHLRNPKMHVLFTNKTPTDVETCLYSVMSSLSCKISAPAKWVLSPTGT